MLYKTAWRYTLAANCVAPIWSAGVDPTKIPVFTRYLWKITTRDRKQMAPPVIFLNVCLDTPYTRFQTAKRYLLAFWRYTFLNKLSFFCKKQFLNFQTGCRNIWTFSIGQKSKNAGSNQVLHADNFLILDSVCPRGAGRRRSSPQKRGRKKSFFPGISGGRIYW